MKVNPLNVVNLLLATFQSLKIEDSSINHKEIELKGHIESILLHAMNEFSDVEMIIEESLDFQEQYKHVDAEIVEDVIQHTIPQSPSAPTEKCTEDIEEVSYDYKLRAVEFWRSGKKKNLNIDSVRKNIKRVTSTKQLRR